MAEGGHEDKVDSGLGISANDPVSPGEHLPSPFPSHDCYPKPQRQTSVSKGYRDNLFVSGLPSNYRCMECHNALTEPMQTECGHLGCKDCMRGITLKEGEGKCPAVVEDGKTCGETIYYDALYPDFSVKKEMGLLQIYCLYRAFGCNAIMLFKELEKHLKSCKFQHSDSQSNQGYMETESETEHRMIDSDTGSIIDRIDSAHEAIKNVAERIEELKTPVQSHNSQIEDIQVMLLELKEFIFDRVGKSLDKIEQRISGQDNKLENVQAALSIIANKGDFDQNMKIYNAMKTSLQVLDKQCKAIERDLEMVTTKHKTMPEDIRVTVISNDKVIEAQEAATSKFDTRINEFENSTDAGILIWKINDYTSKKQMQSCMHSPCFSSHSFGYRLALELFLNGDSVGKNTHASLYIKIVPGDYDAVLPWPFSWKVTFDLMSQTGGLPQSKSFQPEASNKSFRRSYQNIREPSVSQGTPAGFPLFVPHSVLESDDYLKDDTIFIRATVHKPDGFNFP